MEGVAAEAASLAGHLRLGHLISLYLDNRITIEGATDLAFSEAVATRFLAYGWQVQRAEGENLAEIDAAIEAAKNDPRPSLIIARTHIGFGAPTKQDTADAHGAPLGANELAQTKQAFGRKPDGHFVIPASVHQHMGQAVRRGRALERQWTRRFDRLNQSLHSPLTAWLQSREGGLPDGWGEELPTFDPADGPMATRKASGIVLNALAARLPLLLGGSADLAPPTTPNSKVKPPFVPATAAAIFTSASGSTPWAPSSTAYPTPTASFPSAAPFSSSPNTCARPCGWPP